MRWRWWRRGIFAVVVAVKVREEEGKLKNESTKSLLRRDSLRLRLEIFHLYIERERVINNVCLKLDKQFNTRRKYPTPRRRRRMEDVCFKFNPNREDNSHRRITVLPINNNKLLYFLNSCLF